ncbi:phosphoadenosine phosphosulfate reductase [Micromonospora sp. CB01531]|uniref:phosphoadenosine phosphosulfate reductase n=1 Tax=Micromonospora sp. CB01531 TaxID=1718947 RepID=UPI000AB635CE|nr:phosphoadenosine phosphosulfate reductase [Micromonospora sp. CB01531]
MLAATGRIDFRTFLFSNVGHDSEHPGTLDYIERYAAPYAARHGIELVELHRRPTRGRSAGQVETLYSRLMRDGSRSLPIPVRMDNGAPGTRSCTVDFKIKNIGRWLTANGASDTNKATVGIGISLDEIHRVNARRAMPYEVPVYPLLDHDPPLRRQDCEGIIRSAGLPVPPKSSCWFCPFHTPQRWAEMRRDEPDLFAKACHLEDTLNARRDELGKDHVYLTRFARPLADAIPVAGAMLPIFDVASDDDALCDNGACFT